MNESKNNRFAVGKRSYFPSANTSDTRKGHSTSLSSEKKHNWKEGEQSFKVIQTV